MVTVTDSSKLYHALLANNAPTKFIACLGRGHFPADPINRKDVYGGWMNWIVKHHTTKLEKQKTKSIK